LPSPTLTIYFALVLFLMAQEKHPQQPAGALKQLHFNGDSREASDEKAESPYPGRGFGLLPGQKSSAGIGALR
jgi:hypothetical protein